MLCVGSSLKGHSGAAPCGRDTQAGLPDGSSACRQDLFSPFGPISRIYIAYDRDTGEARGFAFVNFVYSQDAQRAIEKLDGCATMSAAEPYSLITPQQKLGLHSSCCAQ